MQRRLIKLFGGAHVFIYRITGGRIGGWIPGGPPILLLTTTGRKSGAQRTTPLQYLHDGTRYVVVASFGGSPTHPAWWLNLRASGRATIQVGSAKMAATASEAEGEERERLWAELTEMYPAYGTYQSKTKRRIPVVVLELS